MKKNAAKQHHEQSRIKYANKKFELRPSIEQQSGFICLSHKALLYRDEGGGAKCPSPLYLTSLNECM